MYEGALGAWNLIVTGRGGYSSFLFLFSLHVSEKGGGEGREGGRRSAAVLGARLATAVLYSIF